MKAEMKSAESMQLDIIGMKTDIESAEKKQEGLEKERVEV